MSARYEALLDRIDEFDAAHEGYNQLRRWSWLDTTHKKIVPGRDADCSASCAGLWWLAGYPINISGTCYTGNITDLATAPGVGGTTRDVRGYDIGSIQRLALPGCMLLGDGHVMIMGRNRRWLSCNQDEHGGIIGGQPGEQDPNETGFRDLWNRHGGWLTLIYPPADAATTPTHATSSAAIPPNIAVLQVGSSGTAVRHLQDGLNKAFPAYSKLTVDGLFGPATKAVVAEFQRRAHLVADGIVGPSTRHALAGYRVMW